MRIPDKHPCKPPSHTHGIHGMSHKVCSIMPFTGIWRNHMTAAAGPCSIVIHPLSGCWTRDATRGRLPTRRHPQLRVLSPTEHIPDLAVWRWAPIAGATLAAEGGFPETPRRRLPLQLPLRRRPSPPPAPPPLRLRLPNAIATGPRPPRIPTLRTTTATNVTTAMLLLPLLPSTVLLFQSYLLPLFQLPLFLLLQELMALLPPLLPLLTLLPQLRGTTTKQNYYYHQTTTTTTTTATTATTTAAATTTATTTSSSPTPPPTPTPSYSVSHSCDIDKYTNTLRVVSSAQRMYNTRVTLVGVGGHCLVEFCHASEHSRHHHHHPRHIIITSSIIRILSLFTVTLLYTRHMLQTSISLHSAIL